MARVAGRDVVLELLDTVRQLKTNADRHEVDLRRLNTRMDSMAARMVEVVERMTALAAETSLLRASVVAMSTDMTAFAGDLKHLAEGYSETKVLVGRLAKLLTEYAGSNDERMDELEARVLKLEKKSA